jgi:hypothetical protein
MPGLESQVDLDKLIRQYDEATDPLHGSEERVQEVVDALDEVRDHDIRALIDTHHAGVGGDARPWRSLQAGRAAALYMVFVEVGMPSVLVQDPGHHRARAAGSPTISGCAVGQLLGTVCRASGYGEGASHAGPRSGGRANGTPTSSDFTWRLKPSYNFASPSGTRS